ncbi:hypothetical protein QVD17_01083 [Tagetes erecta]|uniref:BHLH domain-containing protein n=1 Tax=Tagetes erecta TaxID=13708 RepID=A0AAD8L5S9_TARER|nr:hypothetical protein QVD17_01083 [Tagetes erecta]
MENEGNGNCSIFGMGIEGSEMNCFFNTNSMDQKDLFESALSSIVSSPSNSHHAVQFPCVGVGGGGESIVLRELIGRLGSICNSSEINGNNSSNNSCYNTPLNSPPKVVNMSITGHHQFPVDPSRFSTFGGKNELSHVIESGKLSRVSSNQSFKKMNKLSMELDESSVSETETGTGNGIGVKGQSNNANGRKRKVVAKGKGKETNAKDDKVVTEVEKEESDAKRSKSNEEKKSNEKSTEPPKDYIHVRARRGQATDSHSLAERVRREKISERMKFLQDLVPGCNKVTGKAVMLDEIINYVQSLQRQVEFLSMKLATVNPRMDASMEALLSKDMFQPQVSMPNIANPFDTSAQSFPYGFQSQLNGMVPDRPENQFSMNPLMAAMHRNSVIKPPHIDGFIEASTLWENDLQSVVKMALGQDQSQGFLGQMKVEL